MIEVAADPSRHNKSFILRRANILYFAKTDMRLSPSRRTKDLLFLRMKVELVGDTR